MQEYKVVTKNYKKSIEEYLKYSEKINADEDSLILYGEMQEISTSVTLFILDYFMIPFFIKKSSANVQSLKEEFYRQLHNVIFVEIKAILESNKELFLDGFIQFRLKRYFYITNDFIFKAECEAINVAKYESFIDLMRKYISEYKGTVHHLKILFIKEKIILLDDSNAEVARKVFTHGEVDAYKKEDYVLNMILSKSPRKISLYCNEVGLNANFIKTLKKLYEEELEISNILDIYSGFQIM